ncbi:hypothetical protein DRN87_00195 [Candidatus Geothermarchaeota archaeon]|nr:MAG: hypothetical protein DRN87_00195 [Candidatus Geothermarchaeota archaeon]
MSDITQLIEIYERLFTVGSLLRNIILFVLSYLLYICLILMLHPIDYLSIFLGVVPLIYLILTEGYLYTVLADRDRRFYCIRRLLAFSSFENLAMILLMIISTLIGLITNILLPVQSIIILGIVPYEIIVLGSTLYDGEYHGGIISIIKALIVVSSTVHFLKYFLLAIASLTLGLVIGFTTLYSIKRIGYKYEKESIFEYLRGFIDSWLLNDPSHLDRILYKKSSNAEIIIDSILFPSISNRKSYIMVPYFHFGPFKNLGSSNFPAYISRLLYMNNGLLTVVMRGPSTHDRDLASHEEMDDIANKVIEIKNMTHFKRISDIHVYSEDDATIKYMRMDESIILFLEYLYMEDIPYDIADVLKNAGRKLGYKNVIVVDSHNSLVDKKFKMSEEIIEKILQSGLKALEKAKNLDLYPFKYYINKIELPDISPKDGLGSNGIGIIVFETPLNRNGIIVLDSNNLHSELKKQIENMVLDKYLDQVVVITTDTHEVTAHEVIEGGYRTLGESPNIRRRVLSAISILFDDIESNLYAGEGYIYTHEIEMKIIGYNAIKHLSAMTVKAFKYTKKILKYFTTVSVILSVILLNLALIII